MGEKRLRVFVPLVLALVAALPALGNTITVTNTSDSGPGSLRAAIAAASPGDTIDFGLTYPATITLASTLDIGTDLAISGPGASNLAISGNNAVGVFHVSSGVAVSISGVTIENGTAFYGAGIYNTGGRVTLATSTVSGNSATYYGGGIYNYGGTVTLATSTVSGNSAAYYGGGIYDFDGTLTLTNSTVSGNSAAYNYGGGIYNFSGTVTVTTSTVSGNSAGYYGGGVYNYLGALTLTNSTVSDNSATYYAGGIFNYNQATLTLANSTVSSNSAGYYGGGVYSYYATVILKNTVMANSTGGNCWATGGTLTSDGFNLSDDTSCVGILTSTTDQNNISAGLDFNGLQDNGGPTKTIALLSASPAVDAIPVADCMLPDGTTPVATDQRGISRPGGFACDVGAFELVGSSSFSSFTAKLDIHAGSTLGTTPSGFDLKSVFTLGAGSNGINPLSEVVKLQVGTYQATIPANSFHQLRKGAKKGSYVFSGVIDGVSLSVQIVPLAGNSYQFKAEASRADLTALANPVTLTLTIGDDTGTTSVYAEF